MLHVIDALQHVHEAVVYADRVGTLLLKCKEVCHGDVTSEAYHLVPDGVLKSEHHAHADNHNGKTYRHTYCGNTNGRAAHLMFVSLVIVNLAGYE